MKARALQHLLLAAGRSVGDRRPDLAVDRVCATLAVERVERGRFRLTWTDAAGGRHELPLDGARFHLYARGDVAGHVARRAPGTDHRGHNWSTAHEVWAEVLGVAPEELVPTGRTFAPRGALADDPDRGRAVAVGAVVGAVTGIALAGRTARRLGAGAPPPAALLGVLAVVAAGRGPDDRRAAGLTAALGVLAPAASDAWQPAAQALLAADVLATTLRREPARRAVSAATLTAALAGSVRRTAARRTAGAADGPGTRVVPSTTSWAVATGVLAVTAVQAPRGHRDRLSGWLTPLALAVGALGAEARGDRSAVVVGAAALGGLGGATVAPHLLRRPVPPATPPSTTRRPATGVDGTARPGAVIVPLPVRRSA